MSAVTYVATAIVLLIIFAQLADRQFLSGQLERERQARKSSADEAARLRQELRRLKQDDARFVDELLERGRQEIAELEEHYRRNLPKRQRPDDGRWSA